MYPTFALEMQWNGEWQEIGWRASTPESLEALEKHGQALSDSGETIRLVAVSVFAGQPSEPIRAFA